jgi:microcystin-dependent protein
MEGMIGEIRMFGGNFPPRNWAFCDGQLLAISQNDALFSIIGTIYGGDGRTTFGLPDLRGRAAIGPGNGPGLPQYRLGERGGQVELNLTAQNLPSHAHTLNASNAAGTGSNPAGNFPAVSQVQVERGGESLEVKAYGTAPNSQMAGNTIGNTGGGVPFGVRNPCLGAYYIICLVGIYPSRS